MSSLLKLHENLPPGVHPYPTELGRKRFEMLVVFNLIVGIYILLHRVIVPVAIYALQTQSSPKPLELGYWYLYHFTLAIMLLERFRTPANAFHIIYLAWFGFGYLPLSLVNSFLDDGTFRLKWKAISGLLCYGSSLVFTMFLLYRMRMPTTAFLFRLEERIIPKWRYAVPYAVLGALISCFIVLCPWKPFAKSEPQPALTQPAFPEKKKSVYE